jgi:hypothetical protein
MIEVVYPLAEVDFRPWARSVLGVESLEDLHERDDPRPFAHYVERLEFYTGLLKDNFGEVEREYMALVDLVAAIFGGVELRQRPPSFRCHLVGAGTVSSFHRDGDAKYGITEGIVNCWVPLTAVGGTNSLYVESAPGSADHRPISLGPGRMAIFDAYHLEHGSRPNRSERSRVSFDFRFLPTDRDRTRELGFA